MTRLSKKINNGIFIDCLAMYMDGQLILRKARGLLYQFRQLPKIPCTLSNLCRRCGPGMWDSGHHPAIECVGHTDDDHCILSDEWIQISIVSKCITIRWNSAFEYLYTQNKKQKQKNHYQNSCCVICILILYAVNFAKRFNFVFWFTKFHN